KPDPLVAPQLEHGLGPEAAVQVHVQLGLGPAAQLLFGEARRALARAHYHPEDRPALPHRIATVHRTADPIGHVRGAARDQVGKLVVQLRDGVAHAGARRDAHGSLVHEHADHGALKIAKREWVALPWSAVSKPARHRILVVDDESDRIKGLSLGADDYLPKPFSPQELVLRVAAVLRRLAAPAVAAGGLVTAGPIAVDRHAHRVTVNGAEVELTATEFKLLTTLI